MTSLIIRCPGTNGNGCEGLLDLASGGTMCFVCGEDFEPEELLDLYIRENGWMEAELLET